MSLRLRLTLLYTSLLGGVLSLFGAFVYGLVSVVLMNQIDNTLSSAANELIFYIHINSSGQIVFRSLYDIEVGDNLNFEVWNNEKKLQSARPIGLQDPLDIVGLRSGKVQFSTVQNEIQKFRVLNVPIQTIREPVGVIQVAIDLTLLEVTQRTLASVLVILVGISMLMFGLASWFVNGQALAPLEIMTKVATNITHANDLSLRIPFTGSTNDEVGKLIITFNQTMHRLEQLFSTQRRFIADVSHELRTPLTVIKGNIGLMRRIKKLDEESLSSVETEVDRMIHMVGDLLLLAQAESGRLPLDLKPIELDTVLLAVYNQMRVVVGERLHMRISDIDQVIINGDRDRIKQVLFNLLGNAIQYTPTGGSVTITLRKVSEKAQLIINDTGTGIPAKDLPHIFERFYRGEKSRVRRDGIGYGLGLPIAFWIVRSHGGTIEVTSQEGKGSTFCVWLPLQK